MNHPFRVMPKKILVALPPILLIMGAAMYPSDRLEAAWDKKPQGVYAVINGRPAHRSKDYIQIEVFSSFYCGHCYNFFRQENTLGKRNKIRFVHTPIQWGEGSKKATEAYLIARDMGKGDEMRARLFEAQFIGNKDISEIGWLKKQASFLGLGKKFGEMLDSGVKAKEIADNLEMAHQLSVDETPTVIIGGNLIVVPRMTGGNINVFVMNIDTIVDSLSKGLR